MEERATPTIIEALQSPQLFGPVLGPLESWTAWLVFLRTLYGLPLTTDQDAEIFYSCTGRDEPFPGGYAESYCVVGRRGGKSRIVSLIAAYEALWGGWEKHLAPGEKGWIFIIATDKKQASICLGYVKSVLSHFPDLVDKEYADEIHLTNGISIGTKTCTFRASRGFSTVCVIADEIAFWRDENSANPAEEVINSILPGLLPGAKLIGISTPYGRMGFLYNVHKEYFGRLSDILIWQASTKTMNPTFSDVTIRRLISRDPSTFRAEFDATFREDIEAFIPLELLTACATRTLALPDLRFRYNAFCDPSGGRIDSMTLAICHIEGEKILLDRLEEFASPFDPGEVIASFSGLLKSYGIRTVTADRYGGVWVEDSFKKNGIAMETSDLPASDIYLNFQPLLSMGKVELLNDDRLLMQFQMLERRTRSGGRDLIDHPPGTHDDCANAAAGAVVFAARNKFLSLEEMSKLLPVIGPHGLPARAEDQKRRDAEEEMREFLGGNRIVK
jgi:hypothetical protein